MIYLDLPNINSVGTVEEQLAEIRSYIYKNNEQMNATLANLTTDKFWENTANAVSSAQSKDETPRLLSQYAKIRDLIIKTATEITKTDEHYSMLLSGSYLAKSQFGDYLKETSVTVDGDSTSFTELYRYSSQIDSDFSDYKLDESMYIRRGLLDEVSGNPIYGIEMGILEKELDVDGETVTLDTAYRTRITPDRWSFLYNDSSGDDSEVAYITAKTIHFPSADIKGGSININDNFIVNSLGEITAKAGTFSGTLASSSLVASFNSWSNQKIQLASSSIDFLGSGEKNFSIDPNGISFYKREGSDALMCSIRRARITDTAHWGLDINLKSGLASFFCISYDSYNVLTYIPPSQLDYTDNFYNSPGLYIREPIDFRGSVLVNGALGYTGTVTTSTGHSITVTKGIITGYT